MEAQAPLRPEHLREILAPFERIGSGVTLAVEDAAGRVLAGTAPDASSGTASGSGEIRADGSIIGRVTAWGPGLTEPALAAVAQALGAALSALVAEHRARGAAELALASIDAEAGGARHRRIDDELALGRRLQRSFVALVAPEVPGYELASYYEQAHEVGGDFFDLFRRVRRGRPLSVVVADVTGKGIAAALLMAFSRPLIHAAIDNTSGPAEALERANRVLRERGAALFITALCGSLSLSSGRFRLANAGHEPPLLIRRDGSPVVLIEGSGPLLGAFRSLGLPETVTELLPGDIVLLYTDGVTDARSATGERFEDRRLLEAIEAARGRSAMDVVDSIRGSVDRFQAGTPPADDVTVVAIGRRPVLRRRRAAETRYLVRGKPRSIFEVPGSGQRAVTILARV